ncbi:SDR family oxidoreductase [Streptomyces sp. PmtG]
MNRFQNKTVLITGGTSGMGLATAHRLLDEGAYVAVTGRDEQRLREAAAGLAAPERVLTVRADAADLGDLDRLTREITAWRGGLDAVFANAGVGVFKPSAEITEADFDLAVDVNFKGVYFTVLKALPLLRDGGAIVLNASWTLHRGLAVASVYSATKAAVHNLARTLAADLAPRAIRVNSVSPGYIDTPMYRAANPDPAAEAATTAQIPLATLGHPDEVAAAVAFLASDRRLVHHGPGPDHRRRPARLGPPDPLNVEGPRCKRIPGVAPNTLSQSSPDRSRGYGDVLTCDAVEVTVVYGHSAEKQSHVGAARRPGVGYVGMTP